MIKRFDRKEEEEEVYWSVRLPGTLGVLPKIPFKLTQSIHVALWKSFFMLKPMKEKVGYSFKRIKKLLGGATSQKSQKEI